LRLPQLICKSFQLSGSENSVEICFDWLKEHSLLSGKALAGPAQPTKNELEESWVKGELMKRGMSRSAPHGQVVKLVDVPAADRPKDAIGLLLAHKVSVLKDLSKPFLLFSISVTWD
jgi:hypothetical protein